MPGARSTGLTGRINRHFDRLRRFYGRVLDATLSARPAVYVIWIGLSLLTIPLFMMSSKELAPMEDQGFVMGIVEAAADATIDQTTFYTEAINREFDSMPEEEQTFQITFPDNGFSGLVLKPWGERKRTVFQILPEAAGEDEPHSRASALRGHAARRCPAAADFPVEFIICSTAEPGEISEICPAIATKGGRQRHVRLPADH